MRAHAVVVLAPPLDQHACLRHRVEDLAVQQLVAQLAVQALHVAVLPGAARLDVERLHPDLAEPLPHRRRGEFAPVVAAHVVRHAARGHQPREPLQHVVRAQLPRHVDGQALARPLVHHHQEPQRQSLVRAGQDEVIRPYVVLPLWPQPDAAAVVQPQPAAARLFPRHLQAGLPPDALHPLVVHVPALVSQHSRDPRRPVSAVHRCQLDDPPGQRRLVVPHTRRVPLHRPRLAEHAARAALAHLR